jgi:hypothetical protein
MSENQVERRTNTVMNNADILLLAIKKISLVT